MASSTITFTGVTNLVRNGQQELIHRVAITLTPTHVEIQLDGCGPGCACYPPIGSDNPAVVRFCHDLDARLRETAFATP